MKAKEREAKRNMSVPELKLELSQTLEKRFRARFKHRVTKVQNPLELRNLRRHIARVKTLIREKTAVRPPSSHHRGGTPAPETPGSVRSA
ncbi:MAG: 50S ribosomal protein L29 [Elusimicrobia bacterium]|nr:50S ribosomal protein L29 [Elusimicrobiota bacterium]